jgi:hypothetical protein
MPEGLAAVMPPEPEPLGWSPFPELHDAVDGTMAATAASKAQMYRIL